MSKLIQGFLMNLDENDWKEHYKEMPEYNNEKKPEPLIIAIFKFRTKEDFDEFHKVVKEKLYNGNKVFDGMQRKGKKQSWFPLPLRPSKFKYVDDEK
tara:strand:+ start:2395 stop:2685 length:291 start_codon:yes stop_codon:yes gene_type:complete